MNSIKQLIAAPLKDLGGFSVRRCLPAAQQKSVGPWVFFDHAGPAEFAPGTGIDVRPHPHINLATVTYLFEGELVHRDSIGSVQTIRPGDINLMVAGKGIVHSERSSQQMRKTGFSFHGLQLWLALPEIDEETKPAFFHYPAPLLPSVSIEGVAVRVMIGKAYGVESPVKTYAQTIYVEAHLAAGKSLSVPAADECAIYVAAGDLQCGNTNIPAFSMAILESSSAATVYANQDARIAIIGGENIGKRFVEWNFVSSNQQRIERAKLEWQNRLFDAVPDDDDEFIPLPENNQ